MSIPSATPLLTPEQIAARQPSRPRWRKAAGDHFSQRAARLRQLASHHPMSDFLLFCAALSEAQAGQFQQALAQPVPALNAAWQGEQLRWLRQSLAHLATSLGDALPAAATGALATLNALDDAPLQTLTHDLLDGVYHPEHPAFAALPLLGASLQILRSLQVVQSEACTDTPDAQHLHEPGHCPACGGLPIASVMESGESGGNEHGVRYVECAWCASQWPVARIQCVGCGNTENIEFVRLTAADSPEESTDSKDAHTRRGVQEIETCPSCQGGLKLVSTLRDPQAIASADDLASLALDMLAAEDGYQRIGFNPLLLPA